MRDRTGSALIVVAALLACVDVGVASARKLEEAANIEVLHAFNTPQSRGKQGGGCAATTAGPITGGAAGQAAFTALCAVALLRRCRRRDTASMI